MAAPKIVPIRAQTFAPVAGASPPPPFQNPTTAGGLALLAQAFNPSRNPALKGIIDRNSADFAAKTERDVARAIEADGMKSWQEFAVEHPEQAGANPYMQQLWENREGAALLTNFNYDMQAELAETDLRFLGVPELSALLDRRQQEYLAPFINRDNVLDTWIEGIGTVRAGLIQSVQAAREDSVVAGLQAELTNGIMGHLDTDTDWRPFADEALLDGKAAGTPDEERWTVALSIIGWGYEPANIHEAYDRIVELYEGDSPFLTDAKQVLNAKKAAATAATRSARSVGDKNTAAIAQKKKDVDAWWVKAFQDIDKTGSVDNDHRQGGYKLNIGDKDVNTAIQAHRDRLMLNVSQGQRLIWERAIDNMTLHTTHIVKMAGNGTIPFPLASKYLERANNAQQTRTVLERPEYKTPQDTLRKRVFSSRITQEGAEEFIFGLETQRVMMFEMQAQTLAAVAQQPTLNEPGNEALLTDVINVIFQSLIANLERLEGQEELDMRKLMDVSPDAVEEHLLKRALLHHANKQQGLSLLFQGLDGQKLSPEMELYFLTNEQRIEAELSAGRE